MNAVVEHCRSWGYVHVVCTVYRPKNDFKLIPRVKTETKHPAEGSFGNEFSSIYNRCGVMA